jgi:UDP-GlcNAc:undecaprenyl-phosphate GlcNAc-1-phosphate transferase
MNALNWFDGIPGQVSTLSTIGFLTIGFLSLSSRVEQPDLALLAFILAGISLGGLLFDFPLPRILMGDTGSMFFGLMLGVLTIYAGGKVATAFLVLGVPLTDSFLVILQRILKGTSPLRGSLAGEHLHHRLLAKGWDERQVILLTALLGAAFGVTALFLDTLGKFIAALLLFLLMLVLSLYARPRASLARDASWARGASEH